jgi:hypothetical protein
MDLRPRGVLKDTAGEVYVGRMIGDARGVKAKMTGMGTIETELVGYFKAVPSVSLKVGDAVVDNIISKRCLLTPKEHARIVAELSKEGVATVQFAVDISARADKKAPGGFVWVIKELFPIAGGESDPLAGVVSRVPDNLRAGPAKADPEKAAA